MYEERREKFSFKNFFLTLLLVLLFVFLMLWLFPTKNYVDNKLKGQSTSDSTVYDLDRLSVLYDEIFANNVSRMKEAAIGYFTNERMPSKVGDSKKLTLQEMYDLHLVLKMKDKDGNPCDTKKSYVEMTKFTEEYRLKVNLSCGKQEDYIMVYLGCYNYCPNGICEKKTSTPSKTTAKEEKQLKKETSSKDNKPEKHTCKVVDGKYYDKNGNSVSKSEYDKSCNPTPEKHTCKVVDGKYYDKNGKSVSKTEYDKSCNPEPTKYYCKVVDGKYYDKDGNTVSKIEYDKSCNSTTVKTSYEYKLVVEDSTSCSSWSSWQKEAVKATDLVKVETKTVSEFAGYTITKVPVTKTEIVKKEVTEKYISKYVTELVKIGTKDIQTGTTTKTVTEKVAVGTVEVKTGQIGYGTAVPKDTSTYHYKVISVNTPDSCSYCTNQTKYTWEVYKVETVYDVVTKTVDVPVYKTINVYESREVPIYDFRTVIKEEPVTTTVYEEKKEPKYTDVTYYRYRNCTVTKGYTDIKWSYIKHDSNLTSKGYKLTGKTKVEKTLTAAS